VTLYLDAPAANTHNLQVPHPWCLPDGCVFETRKAPSFEGLLSSLAPEKRAHADSPSVRPYLSSYGRSDADWSG